MTAVPWSPMVPEASTTSPTCTRRAANSRPAGTRPTPAVVMYIASAAPRSTTFVSPVTTGTPAAAAASAMSATTSRNTSMGRPSSSTNAAEIAVGRTPIMARSLIVPCTARCPAEPPAKRRGFTT